MSELVCPVESKKAIPVIFNSHPGLESRALDSRLVFRILHSRPLPSMPDKPQTLYLIDGHALLYRSYHAIRPGSMMAADRKTPTNAVFGLAMEIRKLRNRFKPDYMAAIFDPHGTVNRVAQYDEFAAKLGPAFSGYKSHRDAVPDDLRPQIDIAFDLCAGYGIPSFQIEGFEADDVIATLAILAHKRGINIVIVTGDKDLMQIVQPPGAETGGIKIYDPLKDIEFDDDTVFMTKGVKPSQIVDWLGFQGDAVDNIPGVAGVGGQTAVKLLSEHGSMDAALEFYQKKFADRSKEILEFTAAHEIESFKENKEDRKAIKPPKGVKVVEAYLFAQADRARACRELARLDLAVPLIFDLGAMRLNPPEVEKLAPLLKRLDFKTFLRDLDPEKLAQFETTAAGTQAATELSGAAPKALETVCTRVDDGDKFAVFAAEFSRQPRFAISIETTSVSPRASEIVGLAICWKDGEANYLPIRGPMGCATLDEKAVLVELKPRLEDASVKKIGHDIKHETQVLRNHGIMLNGVAFDTLIAGWSLEPAAQRLTIEELTLQHLGLQSAKPSEPVSRKKKPAEESMLDGGEELGQEACTTADCAWRLAECLTPKIRDAGLEPLLRDIEIPLIGVLADMEWTGIRVDAEFLRLMSGRLEKQLAEQETKIYDVAGEKFNISSPKQLGGILEKLGLNATATTATGQISTSEEVLLELAKDHPLPQMILDFRGALKLKSTYVDALPLMIVHSTGRVHARFHQTVAETGRLSSSDPNLQNIPIRTELGRSIRAAFKPGHDDWKILSADYSQIELRILAHYSQDKNLMEAFEKGIDIHTAVAANLNGVSEADVSREHRTQAKAVNFGILYGQSAFGLAKVLGIGRRQAQVIIDAYFERHPGVRQCINEIIAVARDQGFVTTVSGRRRFIPQLNASDRNTKMLGERLAVNTVFQGSAADLIKKAMIDIHGALNDGKQRSKMLLQIHDELLFEAPPEEADALKVLVKTRMENALKLNVPLVVEVGVGDDWLTANEKGTMNEE